MVVMPGAPAGAPQMPGYAPLPAEWTFWADTTVGAVPLGPVAPAAFSCTRPLSGFGKGEVSLPVTSAALDQARLLRLWSWRLWAFYAGEPYWCGVPTGIADDAGPAVRLTLTELPGYLHRRQWDTGPPNRRFNQVEQTVIAAEIAAPVADVGVNIVTSAGPGFARDREYEYLESESRAQLLQNLSEVISGPQYRAEYSMSAGLPRCTLRIAYPRVGGPSGLGMTVSGSATGYGAAWDADQMRTRTFAVGDLPEDAPEGAARPVAVEDRPQPDLPRLDSVDDWPSVLLLSTLRERAATAATQNAEPALQLTAGAVVSDPPLNSYAPGDDVTVRVVTPLLAGGLELTGQLAAIEVDAGADTVGWTVAVKLPPPKARETLTGRLDRLDLIASAAFRRRTAPLP